MGKVTSAKIIGEYKDGESLKLEATIDGELHIGLIRRKTMEILTPIFREHEEEIKDLIGSNKLGAMCRPLLKGDE